MWRTVRKKRSLRWRIWRDVVGRKMGNDWVKARNVIERDVLDGKELGRRFNGRDKKIGELKEMGPHVGRRQL
ncbi:uncharacterized protein G2W53_000308 [Senna tora]|uniref:Uncharacterized protein n=1 Tax=Senna tora TaxID=362788 RepID=A0A834XHM3_9FABA|nr:uncharacterized protein G2W53_000308 [Senna tora]